MTSINTNCGSDGAGVRLGLVAPDFALITEQNTEWRLSEHIGNVVVLLFYPQNETLVCTRQLCSVRDNWSTYVETKAEIVGISPGTPDDHLAFSERRKLPIRLLADPVSEITRTYGKHWLYPINFTRAIVVIDAKGVVRSRNVMLRAFRPSDGEVLTDIYAARGDAFNDKYEQLKTRMRRINAD